MIELAFVICLDAAPEICEDRSLLLIDVTPERCMMGAQPELARWAEGHEGWRIASWTCRTVDPNTQDI